MNGVPAVYLGKIVSKEHFRVFIYSPDGSQKLVESWDEYEQHMESGLWFALKEDAMTRIPVEKTKNIKKQSEKEDTKLKQGKPLEEKTFEVKRDDFLPKASK